MASAMPKSGAADGSRLQYTSVERRASPESFRQSHHKRASSLRAAAAIARAATRVLLLVWYTAISVATARWTGTNLAWKLAPFGGGCQILARGSDKSRIMHSCQRFHDRA